MYYDDIEYARKRLVGTVVKLLDQEVLFSVSSVEPGPKGDLICSGYNLSTDELILVMLSQIDLTPIKLGMVNMKESVTFTARKPMRKDWRQGLSRTSLKIYNPSHSSEDFNLKLLNQPAFNNYPSLSQALSLIQTPKTKAKAFSRDFCIKRQEDSIELFYRIYPVGMVVNGVPVLDSQNFFLQQHLENSVR
jgi:hypothetical protein